MDILKIVQKLEQSLERRDYIEIRFYTHIKNTIPEIEYNFWFNNFQIQTISSNNHVLVVVESLLHKKSLTTFYWDLILQAFGMAIGGDFSLEIHVEDQTSLILD